MIKLVFSQTAVRRNLSMTTKDDIYFEIFDAGDIVRIEFASNDRSSELGWDNEWIKTKVIVKGGKFSGQYNAEFMTFDFENFKKELEPLYDNLNGSANFNGLEGQLELRISGDGLGHFDVNVIACDQPGVGGKLTFTMAFDQTMIKELVVQLDNILNASRP